MFRTGVRIPPGPRFPCYDEHLCKDVRHSTDFLFEAFLIPYEAGPENGRIQFSYRSEESENGLRSDTGLRSANRAYEIITMSS